MRDQPFNLSIQQRPFYLVLLEAKHPVISEDIDPFKRESLLTEVINCELQNPYGHGIRNYLFVLFLFGT
jgi:hypothetical protein